MQTFAIVAEGITDQIVLENVIRGVLRGHCSDEIVVNYVQPRLDETAKSAQHSPGGWTLVLDYLRSGTYVEALQWNDFVVVHIDTDVSHEVGFEVPWKEDGRDLPPDELVERVIAKLRGLIAPEILQEHDSRFLFAVAVHSIECWLLPLLHTNKKAAKIAGCLESMNNELRRANRDKLSKSDGSKLPSAYRAESSAYAKSSVISQCMERNPSLGLFCLKLKELVTNLAEDEASS